MEFKLDELNKETFERICEIQTPANSVISSFGVSKQDIENWCKKTHFLRPFKKREVKNTMKIEENAGMWDL